MRRILITGITGFVGSHLADFALEKMPEAKIYGVRRWHLSRMDNVRHIQDRIEWIDCDLTDPIGVRAMLEAATPDWIFHCAAESFVSPSWKHPNRYMTANYTATLNILEGLRESELNARIHLPGSGEEYGDIAEDELPITPETVLRPVNPYAVTKIAQDLIGYVYFKSYGTQVIRTRAFNHEGPRRMHVFGIPWYAYQIARAEAGLQEPKLRVGHVDDRRNFTHVRDMVRAYWMAIDKCEPGEMYLIGSEDEASIHTFRDALERLIELSTLDEITYETDPEFIRPTNVPRLIADTSGFRKATSWAPEIDFETIMTETLEYWRTEVRREQGR
jgi:GDP-4-dehydro-6-deoxy-D-mannose reductase